METVGAVSNTVTVLRVSLKLHQLIRGLVVICYHHAGFRKQHGLGFAQPYRGTELSLLVGWAGTRAFGPNQVVILKEGLITPISKSSANY
jgi:hypothetical protein